MITVKGIVKAYKAEHSKGVTPGPTIPYDPCLV